jgi:hypothetical protein
MLQPGPARLLWMEARLRGWVGKRLSKPPRKGARARREEVLGTTHTTRLAAYKTSPNGAHVSEATEGPQPWVLVGVCRPPCGTEVPGVLLVAIPLADCLRARINPLCQFATQAPGGSLRRTAGHPAPPASAEMKVSPLWTRNRMRSRAVARIQRRRGSSSVVSAADHHTVVYISAAGSSRHEFHQVTHGRARGRPTCTPRRAFPTSLSHPSLSFPSTPLPLALFVAGP